MKQYQAPELNLIKITETVDTFLVSQPIGYADVRDWYDPNEVIEKK